MTDTDEEKKSDFFILFPGSKLSHVVTYQAIYDSVMTWLTLLELPAFWLVEKEMESSI